MRSLKRSHLKSPILTYSIIQSAIQTLSGNRMFPLNVIAL